MKCYESGIRTTPAEPSKKASWRAFLFLFFFSFWSFVLFSISCIIASSHRRPFSRYRSPPASHNGLPRDPLGGSQADVDMLSMIFSLLLFCHLKRLLSPISTCLDADLLDLQLATMLKKQDMLCSKYFIIKNLNMNMNSCSCMLENWRFFYLRLTFYFTLFFV